MREILFRGKRTENDKWVKGFPYITHGGEHQIRYYDSESNIENCSHTVIPDTLGRFTGLTDRNGVKIFEGDIVRYGDTIHRVVFEQRNGTAYFGLVYAACETLPFGHYQDLKQIEVIGNVYDNPELLEVNSDE